MKKSLGVAALALATTAALSACAGSTGSESTGSSGSSSDGIQSIIYLTPTPLGGNTFLELGKDAVDQVAADRDGTADTYESTDDQSRRSNLEAAIAKAPDLIVMTTFTFVDQAQEAAEANPEQKFLLLDACPEAPAANLYCATFKEQEPSYVLGVEAAMLSKSGTVGWVAAIDIPLLQRYAQAFEQGVHDTDPDIDIKSAFIGGDNPFADPARAKEQALALNAAGADVVFSIASGSDLGSFEAAAQKDFLAFGTDVGGCSAQPGHIVDAASKRIDDVVTQMVDKIDDGLDENNVSFGMASKGMLPVSLLPAEDSTDCVALENPDVMAAVKDVTAKIEDGSLVPVDALAGGSNN